MPCQHCNEATGVKRLKRIALHAIADYQDVACDGVVTVSNKLLMMGCVAATRILKDGITLDQWDKIYAALEDSNEDNQVSLRGWFGAISGGYVLMAEDRRLLLVKTNKKTVFEGNKFNGLGYDERPVDLRIVGTLMFDKKDVPYLLATTIE